MPGPPSAPPSAFGAAGRGSHFRAHARRAVRLAVGLTGARQERQGIVVDVSLAGAGLETDEPLVPGERITMSFTTPTLWDPLLVTAVVAWAEGPRATAELDALGRPRIVARGGVAFEHPDPPSVMAMFELLASLAYE